MYMQASPKDQPVKTQHVPSGLCPTPPHASTLHIQALTLQHPQRCNVCVLRNTHRTTVLEGQTKNRANRRCVPLNK